MHGIVSTLVGCILVALTKMYLFTPNMLRYANILHELSDTMSNVVKGLKDSPAVA